MAGYTYAQALTELRRQLDTGEATREQYEQAYQNCENQMVEMHLHAEYDVLGYMQLEQTANVYREVLGLPKSTISARAQVSPTLTDAEYQAAMVQQLGAQPQERSAAGKRCHYCGLPATAIGPFGEAICPECGG